MPLSDNKQGKNEALYDFGDFPSQYVIVDFFKEARDRYLSRILSDYPNVRFISFFLNFTVNATAKNGDIIYAILNTMPEGIVRQSKNEIKIIALTEQDLLENFPRIIDIITVAGKWRTTIIEYNGVQLDSLGFRYLCNYYEEKINTTFRSTGNIQALRKAFLSGSRTHTRRRKTEQLPTVTLSSQKPEQTLQQVVDRYVRLYGKTTNNQFYTISNNEIVLVMEDSLIVDFRINALPWRREDDPLWKVREWEYPEVILQELTPNTLFQFNYAGFRRNFSFERVGMDYFKFRGYSKTDSTISRFVAVNRTLPFLELEKRYEQYPGETVHFIVLIMEGIEGAKHFGIGYTKGLVHSFILKLCKELENKNTRSPEVSCLPYVENEDFVSAFLSWKGEKKRWRVENKFSYYYEDRQIKSETGLYESLREILTTAQLDMYQGELGYYAKPLNRWKSEELVYNITKKLYKDYQVVYQYRPRFLCTDGGNMSYDVYICGLRVAIEYQGKQHFAPVEYFGGEENFEKQKARDLLKAERSKENGVKLVYINYWESITPELIKQRVEQE